MRVRDHIVLSTAGAALLRQWTRGGAAGLVAGGVLIDADHYAWYLLRHRQLNPVAAIRFFNEAHPPQHPGTRLLHSPAALLAAAAAGLRWPRLRPVAAGMGLHIALDTQHAARMRRVRAAVLERDGYRCRACGSQTRIDAHVRRQPWLLPSYSAGDLISLCHGCHESAHAGRRGPRRWI